MTAQEIKDILEANMSVEAFAFDEFSIPDDFVFSEEVEKAKEIEEAASEAMHNCEYYKMSWEERQEASPELRAEYDELYSVWLNSRSYKVQEKEFMVSLGVGEWEKVAQHGGEGQGDEWYSIKYFKDHNVYLKCDGYYQSYNGTEFYDGWNDVYEVKPEQKTITVFEKLK